MSRRREAAPAPPAVSALPEAFFARPAAEVARDLLGAVLTSRTDEGVVGLRLVEVEAYGGADDPASHAWRGPTARNAAMFGPPGRLYVYRSYGLHWCCNVVTGRVDDPSAVLMRAAELTAGVDIVRRRRPRSPERDLARGPGRLCAAAGVAGEWDGSPVTGGGPMTLHQGTGVPEELVRVGPRVGVSRATEVPWRLSVADHPAVSTFRRGRTSPERDGRDRNARRPPAGPEVDGPTPAAQE